MNEPSLFNFPYFRFLAFLWGIYSGLFILCYLLKRKSPFLSLTTYLLGIGLISIGFVTGCIMGNNRNPIGDSIMSSVFTLLGTVITYIFLNRKKEKDEGKDNIVPAILGNSGNRIIVSLFLILFPTALLYGAHLGNGFRFQNEEIDRIIQHNVKLGIDSTDLWKKQQEASIQRMTHYYEVLYDTWSENEKKHYEELLKQNKADTIPEVPEYLNYDDSIGTK